MSEWATIYVLIDPRDCEIRYVGWTNAPLAKRLATHMRIPARQTHHRACWLRAIKRCGMRPRIVPVQRVPMSCWAEAERYWITHFRERGCGLVNGTDGGQGTPGQRHTAAARTKMSAARKGKPSPKRGIPLPEDVKRKLSAATTRQMASPESRAAVSRVHKGKVLSEQQKLATGALTTRRWQAWREQQLGGLDALIASYEAGEHLYVLAARARVAKPTLRRAFVAAGVRIRGTGEWVRPLPAATAS